MEEETDKVVKEVVSKMLEWHKHYNTVRVTLREDGSLMARKLSLIDGKEEDYGVTYEIETIDSGPLPKAGDYPSVLFDDLIVAANYYPIDYLGPIKTCESRDILIFKESLYNSND